jgi:hypothetical protein
VIRDGWARWKRFAHRAAEIQALILLSVLYWVAVVPIGLIRRNARRSSDGPHWLARAPAPPISVEDARRQF